MSQFLNSAIAFEVNDPDAVGDMFRTDYAASHFDCDTRGEPFFSKGIWVGTKSIQITKTSCSSAFAVSCNETPDVKIFFPKGSPGEASIGTRRDSQDLPTSHCAMIVPANTPHKLVVDGPHQATILRIDDSAVKNIANAMLGNELNGDLQFRSQLQKSEAAFQEMQTNSMQLFDDLKTFVPCDSGVADALSQALIVRLLMSSSHQFSDQLEKEVLPPSLAQLRKVEEFIAANWQRELDVERSRKHSASASAVFSATSKRSAA